MGDANSADSKTLENGSTSSSIGDVERKMILLKVEESEKSRFDDIITGAESENGWENCWKETENSVTQTVDDLETKRSIPEEWVDQLLAPEQPMIFNQAPQVPSAPHSHYALMDLNREPVDNSVRMARVPSQYQLDALSEMFIFDVPQHYTMTRNTTTANCQPLPTNIVSADQDDRPIVNDWSTPYFVNSEYVSELLM